MTEDGEPTHGINRGSRAAWACLKKFAREHIDRQSVPSRLKVLMLNAEAMEALLHGCMTWAPRCDHFALLRTAHHRLQLRVIGYRCERGTYRPHIVWQSARKDLGPIVEAIIRQR